MRMRREIIFYFNLSRRRLKTTGRQKQPITKIAETRKNKLNKK
jgi:hypothetical protein